MSWQILGLLVKLDEAEQRMQLLSHTDELTQTHNRRYFMQYADQELKRSQRSGEKFSIAILDLKIRCQAFPSISQGILKVALMITF